MNEAIRREAEEDGVSPPDLGLGQMFSNPNFLTKLAANPRTSALLGDPSFMAKLNRVRQDPSTIQEELRDPRMMQVIAVLLGIHMETPENAAQAAADIAGGNKKEVEEGEDVPMEDAPPTQAHEEEEEAKAKKEAKEQADREKALGTENYKKRQFDAAIEHYTKAWELCKDITYLNNIAAAKYEAGDLEGCIQECQKAIEEGREMRADFKLVAKYDPPLPPPENYCRSCDWY